MRHRGPDDSEILATILAVIAAIPVAITIIVALLAGCFTVIWHIGHWVNWW